MRPCEDCGSLCEGNVCSDCEAVRETFLEDCFLRVGSAQYDKQVGFINSMLEEPSVDRFTEQDEIENNARV